MIDTFKKKP